VLLRHLGQGVLLVTGPFKVNGVPLRRVNSRFVMATSTKVDVKGVDEKVLKKVADPKYFGRATKDKKKGEEAFFKQGEKPEVRDGSATVCGRLILAQKKTIDKSRVEDQKAVDKALVAAIKKTEMLESYLRTSFSLRHGQRPHEMVF
jgi:large subunit ribosomal protein L6e